MKFSIRDLFLVTVIVALVLGWGLDHRRLSFSRSEFDFYRNGWLEQRRIILEITETDNDPPNSQAPAPNPPKP